MNRTFPAILFDLLSALVDSWSLWDDLAGNSRLGRRWRMGYLDAASRTLGYRPYLDLVAEAADAVGIPPSQASALAGRWNHLTPWPEAARIIAELAPKAKVGVVTNCSEELGLACASRIWPDFDVVVTAERAGCYKPYPAIYEMAITEIDVAPDRILYVAGSPYDVIGAANAGMRVYWHNRLGMTDESAHAAALGSFATLEALRDLVF